MYMKRICLLCIAVVVLCANGCITPFEPEGMAGYKKMLVVEGNIILGGITTVSLAYSMDLDDDGKIVYVQDANVRVESESGSVYEAVKVVEDGVVSYQADMSDAGLDDRYRLYLVVKGKDYESDFVPVKVAPPIDTVAYMVTGDSTEVEFYVNSRDRTNSTRYYMWSYTEAWEFNPRIYSEFRYDPFSKEIFGIADYENRFNCWQNSKSTAVLIATTDFLDEDVVYRKKLNSIGRYENRINYLYSMELTQYALTREAYLYWENIKKNSDDIGGIFSPQPSEMSGNIRCVSDSDEYVIGYISATVPSKKRIFAYSSDIGIYKYPYDCFSEIIGNDYFLRDSLYHMGMDVILYEPDTGESHWAPKRCVDCTIFGTKEKPSYWPNNHQ